MKDTKLCPLYDYSEIVPIVPAVEVLEPEPLAVPCMHDLTPSAPLEPVETAAASASAVVEESEDDAETDAPEEIFEEDELVEMPAPEKVQVDSEISKRQKPLEKALLVASGVMGCYVLGPLLATLGVGAVYVYVQKPNDYDRVPVNGSPPERVLVVHRVHSKGILHHSINRVGKAAYWIVEKASISSKGPREQVVGAGVTTGLLSCALGGPICGVVAGCGTALAASHDDGVAGDTARAVGEVALSARDKARAIDRKHQVVKKSRAVGQKAWRKAKSVEEKHKAVHRTKRSVVRCFRVAVVFLHDRVLEPGRKSVEDAIHWVTSVTVIEQSKPQLLDPVLVGVEPQKVLA